MRGDDLVVHIDGEVLTFPKEVTQQVDRLLDIAARNSYRAFEQYTEPLFVILEEFREVVERPSRRSTWPPCASP